MTGTGGSVTTARDCCGSRSQPPLPPTKGSRLRTVSLLASLAPEFALTVVVLTGGLGASRHADRRAAPGPARSSMPAAAGWASSPPLPT